MKLSVSVYAGERDLADSLVNSLKRLDVDYLHVDCRGEAHVFEDIRRWSRLSGIPCDVHLIHPEPELFLSTLNEAGTGRLSLQWELISKVPEAFFDMGFQRGMAIQASTNPELLSPIAHRLDYIMLMSGTPGMSGGNFEPEVFQRIHQIRKLFPGMPIQVDGGVNESVACVLRILGVELAVSGSWVLGQNTVEEGLYRFSRPLSNQDSLHWKLQDFMWPLTDLPSVSEKAGFYDVLRTIDTYRMGFCLVLRQDGRLSGVISNADVRKALLRFNGETAHPSAADMVNRNPVSLKPENSLRDLVHLLNELPSIVLFLPIVSENGLPCGAVLLNHLTRF